MPDTPPARGSHWKAWEIFRAAAIVLLLAFLSYRLFCRDAAGAPLESPSDGILVNAPVPRDVMDRLDAVGWQRQVGAGLGLWVSANWQRLVGIQGGIVRFAYSCSTAAKGVGNQEGSNQTPPGWHEIAERIGDGLPEGAVFNERKYTGRVWTGDAPTERDFVLTRILWLRGREPGINVGKGVDSHERYIYIHGTPAEGKIGTPASMGCVRMRNREVIELFDRAPTGTPVLITEW
jgi:hypothetical protein